MTAAEVNFEKFVVIVLLQEMYLLASFSSLINSYYSIQAVSYINFCISKRSMQRQTAVKARIGSILSSQFVNSQDQPSHIILNGVPVGRVNIIGTVVQKDGTSTSVVLDDGEGSIQLRPFDVLLSLEQCNVGDLMLVIGRLRKFGNETYIVPEIAKKISDPTWVLVRQKELPSSSSIESSNNNTIHSLNSSTENYNTTTENVIPDEPKLVQLVQQFDAGDGADYEVILAESGLMNAIEQIQKLIMEGVLFMPKPGRLKVLI